MRLFSARKNKGNNTKKLGRKVLIVTGVMLALFMAGPVVSNSSNNMFGMTTYAAEQTYSWVQEGNVWKVKDSMGNTATNSWYKDTDGSYYYLSEDGSMLTGILYKDGNAYYLGEDGKMVVTDGVYHGVSMTFDKDSNGGHYGNITSGLGEMLFTGVRVTNLYVAPQVDNSTTQTQSQVQNENIYHARNAGYDAQTSDAQSLNRAFTQEELSRMKEALDQIR